MTTADPATYSQWLDLDVDCEALDSAERRALEARLADDVDLRAERRALEQLHDLLAAERIGVDEGFEGRVMASLPQAAWQPQRAAWRLPLAMMLGLALAAVTLLANAGSSIGGTAQTVFDFLASTSLAGAGVLVASWRGAGFGLEALFADSQLNLVAFGILVLCLNLLFFSLLRRRPKASVSVHSEER